VDWIDLAQHKDKWQAVLSSAMHNRVPLNGGNFLTSWGTISFSRKTPIPGII